MKLKKIVSLALAGILAVSMLTACGDNGSSSSSSEPVVDTTEYAIASKINDELDSNAAKRVSFTDSTDLQDVVKSYFEENELTVADFKAATTTATYGTLGQKVGTQIMDKLGVDKSGFAAASLASDTVNDPDAGDVSAVEVYILKTSLTEDAIGKVVAKAVNDLTLPKEEDATPVTATYSYTGSVSMTKVETEGKTESVWVVAVVIDKDVVAK